MESFNVEAVYDGNTIEVSPKWEFEGTKGDIVVATGYNPPKKGKPGMSAEQKLSILVHNKKVELGTPQGLDGNKLVCEVFFNGINLADYFSEYKEKTDAEDETEDEAVEEDFVEMDGEEEAA
jgi:hypothetical protein